MKVFDFVIIGTGMGGSAAGYQLSKGGAKVLFLEKGVDLTDQHYGMRGDYAEVLSKGKTNNAIFKASGRNTESLIDKNAGRTFVPFIGCGTGGSTSLYGMTLERFFPEDFAPARNFSAENLKHTSLPDAWPITYNEIAPYYDQVEILFGLSGSRDPLRADHATLSTPLPLSKANKNLYDYFKSKGMHPYQIPTAMNTKKLKRESQGFLDDDGPKRDANQVFLKPALDHFQAKIMTETEVINITAKGRNVKELVCQSGKNIFTIKCQHVILAAGAMTSTKLLLTSCNPENPNGLANSSGLVGKNLMRHYIDLYAIKSKLSNNSDIARKQMAFNDFYNQSGHKLGTFQSFGHLPPDDVILHDLENDLKKYGPLATTAFKGIKPFIKKEVNKLRNSTIVFASILEDLPYEKNRLHICPKSGNIILDYQVASQEAQRISFFRNKIKTLLQPLKYKLIKQAHSNQRIAHVCGTCRFGEDATKSVLDKNNQAHDLNNLTVLDSSFFPSSGGTNPSLTIAANALRVSNHLLNKPTAQEEIYEKSSM